MTINKNIIWLASYPKSGNTWCRIFLSRYLYQINNINEIRIPIYSSKSLIESIALIDVSELTLKELHLLRLEYFSSISDKIFPVKIHDRYQSLLYTHPFLPVDKTLGCIYLVRNPYDVAISFSRHLGKDIDTTIAIMNNNEFTLASSDLYYTIQLPQKLGSWSNHVKSWTEQQDFPTLIVRYEDLIEEPYEAFTKILSFMNVPIDNTKLKDAILFSSFNNLSAQEKLYGFEERSINSSTFFHTGKKEYYKNILNETQKKTIFEHHKDIIEQFNYECYY